MSRTYRRKEQWVEHAHSRFWTEEETKNIPYEETRGWSYRVVINKKGRDKKAWDKPNKKFKQVNRQKERAMVKDAIAKGKELPRFRKSDQWDWT
jgi:hypothetical protein